MRSFVPADRADALYVLEDTVHRFRLYPAHLLRGRAQNVHVQSVADDNRINALHDTTLVEVGLR